MSTSVSVRISEDLAKQLDDVAQETERTRSFIIQKALESYFVEHADLQIALDRLHDSADPVISSARLREHLGV
jgi:predicted transcriptional regulator